MEVNLNGGIYVYETIENGGVKFYPEFDIAGYESPVFEWSDRDNKKPTENYHWARSEKTPNVGDRRVVSINHHFCETDTKDFWTFYQPALTSLNGIDCYLEEIEKYAFVQCRLLEIISINNRQAWLQVLITDTIMIEEAYKIISEKHDNPSFLRNMINFSPYQCNVYGNWEYYFGGDGSGVGNAFLIHKVNRNIRLILFQEDNFHRDSTYLGNLLISEETYNSLARDRKLQE
jgi:hypothetical protein